MVKVAGSMDVAAARLGVLVVPVVAQDATPNTITATRAAMPKSLIVFFIYTPILCARMGAHFNRTGTTFLNTPI
jgi:hypothetical protein